MFATAAGQAVRHQGRLLVVAGLLGSLALVTTAPAAASPADGPVAPPETAAPETPQANCPPVVPGNISSHPGEARTAALTFDDGPHPVWTPRMLDMLARHEVKATFFVVGRRGAEHPELLRRIVAEGHLLANHTWSHPTLEKGGHMDELPLERRADEMDRTTALITAVTGTVPCFYRSPQGWQMSPDTQRLANERGMTVTNWAPRLRDTAGPAAYDRAFVDELVSITTSPMLARPIFLWHDGGPATSDRSNAVAAAEGTIIAYQAAGYRFVDPAGRPFPSDARLAGPAPAGDRLLGRVCPAGMSHAFTDVPDDVHATAIACAATRGIVTGRTPTTFAPAVSVTRAQAATMVHRTLTTGGVALDRGSGPTFPDVADGPHRRAIEDLAAAGVVSGRSAERFDPDAPVTRGQMASMLVRALALQTTSVAPLGPSFADVDPASAHAASIRRLAGAGIAQGIDADRFAPDRPVTRAQMATFVLRADGFAS